jgi:hypothetical protein
MFQSVGANTITGVTHDQLSTRGVSLPTPFRVSIACGLARVLGSAFGFITRPLRFPKRFPRILARILRFLHGVVC